MDGEREQIFWAVDLMTSARERVVEDVEPMRRLLGAIVSRRAVG
jgi:hypothetical protein